MRTLNDVRELHAEPGRQHTTIGSTESDYRGVLILSVVLDHHYQLLIVHECLIESQILDVIFGEGVLSEGQALSIVAMLTEEHHSVEHLRQSSCHEPRVVVEGPHVALVTTVEQDGRVGVIGVHIGLVD